MEDNILDSFAHQKRKEATDPEEKKKLADAAARKAAEESFRHFRQPRG